MNLACDLHNDKWKENPLQSFRIVSLWEMLEFYAEIWLTFYRKTGEAAGNYATMEQVFPLLESFCASLPGNKALKFPEIPMPQQAEQTFIAFKKQLLEIGLSTSAVAVEKLIDYMQNEKTKKTFGEMRFSINEFLNIVEYQLKGKRLLMLDTKHAEYYDKKGTVLGEEVLNRFSQIAELREDAAEAGNCFALENYTACVFHLMRIMERCVQKLGNDLKLSEKITCDQEWQKILNNIRGKVKERYPSEKDSARIKIESVIGHLETVKIAWRNPTMHPKATYTDREAEKIIGAVQAFVEDFSLLTI